MKTTPVGVQTKKNDPTYVLLFIRKPSTVLIQLYQFTIKDCVMRAYFVSIPICLRSALSVFPYIIKSSYLFYLLRTRFISK